MSRERLLELLVDDATQGLGADGHLELQLLLHEHPDVDPDCMEHAVALMHVALLETQEPEPMPHRLRQRLDVMAGRLGDWA